MTATPKGRGQETAAIPGALRGLAWMLAGAFLYSVMDVLIKHLEETYSVVQVVFFRNLFAVLPLVLILAWGRRLGQLATSRLGAQATRSLFWLGATASFFYGLSMMPLADAIAIAFSAPLAVTVLSVLMLGERVGRHRWSAVVVGFGGVLLMVRPTGAVFDPVSLIVLLSAVFYAFTVVMARQLTATETDASIVFYPSAIAAALSGLILPPWWLTPDWLDFAELAATGIIGLFAQFAVIKAIRLADVSLVAPLDYTAILWATLFGFLFWGVVPGAAILAGAALVITSGIYITHREAVKTGA